RLPEGGTIELRVKLPDRVLRLYTSVKRLDRRTTVLFVLWMFGVSVLFLLIAVLFLRNQIRPIRRLAEAADNFGRGVDMPDFRPHGASEVKKAARAFLVMRERIRRQLRTRTEMLAGISHDLRTPLTRMKLELAMLPESEATRESIRELGDDVLQMERMIEEYLNFARGDGREEAVPVSLRGLLEDVVSDYQRQHSKLQLLPSGDAVVGIRVSAMRRVLHNVIDNALRYGTQCRVSLHFREKTADIVVDDNGPGIPADKYEEVFKPFSRLELSRNIKTGGVGLGLSIARDSVLAHGGRIGLDRSELGGLRVVISLPL
ncbi:MAG: HAMP domain-containing protein, partial [Rickettsiales bacterium]|nr:HAMP domain-containing protein [Rickettsiales bacterium]